MRVGRPRVIVDAVLVDSLRAQGLSYRQIARSVGAGLGTVYRASVRRSKTVSKGASVQEHNNNERPYPACADSARFLAG